MKLLSAFLRLIRWPNLFFIALTQALFYFFIFYSEGINQQPVQNNYYFWLLVTASVFIAAAGNIINDYFDLNIDLINKPQRVVVDKLLNRRWVIAWHFVLSLAGLLLSVVVSFSTGAWVILVGNIIAVILLWYYSTNFKKSLLIGNLVIAALTAWVLMVVYFFAGAGFHPNQHLSDQINWPRFFKLFVIYAGFAFITTLIREVIKDLEDMQGDAANKCNTMPIAWGVPAAKVFTGVWLVVCIGSIIVIMLYALQIGWLPVIIYSLLLVVVPLIIVLNKLKQAAMPGEYHFLSSMMKWVMLAGILSMVFFKFSV